MPIEILKAILDEIQKHTSQRIEEEVRRDERNSYVANCPGCGNRVVRDQLVEKGCYICGWQGQTNGSNYAGIGYSAVNEV